MGDVIKTYTNFSGADIVVAINDVVFGELQAITYRVQREVAPLYTMGSADPRGFAKNKRSVSGAMIFLVFDKDSLIYAVKDSKLKFDKWGYSAAANFLRSGADQNYYQSIDDWNTAMRNLGAVSVDKLFTRFSEGNIQYADQIPPFTITITAANEYGATSQMKIHGVQIINEGAGVSIDDLVNEKAVTFVATGLTPLAPIGENSQTSEQEAVQRSVSGLTTSLKY